MTRQLLMVGTLSALMLGCQGTNAPEPDKTPEQTAEAPAPEATPAVQIAKEVPVAELDVEQSVALHTAGMAVFLDANSASTRTERGYVPGATLLTSSSEYAVGELPADKATKLVFYCGSSFCSASDSAADRAVAAGYNDVCVMRPGIKGWIAAGKNVDKSTPQT